MVRAQRRRILKDGDWSDWQSVDYARIWEETLGQTDVRWQTEPDDLYDAAVLRNGLVMPIPELQEGRWKNVLRDEIQQIANDIRASQSDILEKHRQQEIERNRLSPDAANRFLFRRPRAKKKSNALKTANGRASLAGGSTKAGRAAAKKPPVPTERTHSALVPDQLLVRFVDYTVEQGEIYQYRLKVVLINPNKNRRDVDEALRSLSSLESAEWSAPSQIVRVDP